MKIPIISNEPPLLYLTAESDVLKLDENSRVFMINTEGNTDPYEFRRIIWDGENPVPENFRVKRG